MSSGSTINIRQGSIEVSSTSSAQWAPKRRNRSDSVDQPRRKRRKRHDNKITPAINSYRVHGSSDTVPPIISTPVLCSECSALIPSTSHFAGNLIVPSAGQGDLARHTPISEVSSDIKGSTVSNRKAVEISRSRRSRSSILEDLRIRRRTGNRNSTIRTQRTSQPLSASNGLEDDLNESDQSSTPDTGSESSSSSEEDVKDEDQTPPPQSPVMEYHSPVNARTRTSRRISTKREKQPISDLTSTLRDFADDINGPKGGTKEVKTEG